MRHVVQFPCFQLPLPISLGGCPVSVIYTITVASDYRTRSSVSLLSSSQFPVPSAVVLSQLYCRSNLGLCDMSFNLCFPVSVSVFLSFQSLVPCSLNASNYTMRSSLPVFSIRSSLFPIPCSQFPSAIVPSRLYSHSSLGLFNALFSSIYPSRPVFDQLFPPLMAPPDPKIHHCNSCSWTSTVSPEQ